MASLLLSILELGINGRALLWAAVLLCTVVYFYSSRRKGTNIPGPWGLPILGYVPFLGKEPHLTLMELAKKYGNVFGLYLGRTYVVVVSDFNTAKEILNKPSLLDRPPTLFNQLPDGTGFTNLNGEAWTEQRRYVMKEMKNLGFSGSSWEKFVQCEVMDFMELLKKSNGQPMDFERPMSESFISNILSLVYGHRLPLGSSGIHTLKGGVDSFQMIYDQSGIITFFPSLFQVALKLGLLKVKPLIKAMIEMNKYVKGLVENCRQKDADNFISNYLKETEEKKSLRSKSSFNESNLVGNVQALFTGGTHTTKTSMEWLFLAMASYPDIQDKVQKELDSEFPDAEIPVWEDRPKLPYCQATILEGQRWKTLAPLNLVHRSTEDIKVQNYVIPKNTDVITLLWAFHNDTKYWKDPEKFIPERFLTEDGEKIKKCESFAPFSMGKRNCPGEGVAHVELFIFFTAIMSRFRILPAEDGVQPDLTGILGLSYQPRRQMLRFISRK